MGQGSNKESKLMNRIDKRNVEVMRNKKKERKQEQEKENKKREREIEIRDRERINHLETIT